MDHLKLRDEVKALKTMGDHLEQMLKLVGVEICDLPDDVLTLLDESVEIQVQAKLNDLNLNYLREFYYTKKREDIENKLTIAKQKSTLKRFKKLIEETDKDIAELENFTSTVHNRIPTLSTMREDIVKTECKSKALLDRESSFKLPNDFNIESVIEKIDLLERNK